MLLSTTRRQWKTVGIINRPVTIAALRVVVPIISTARDTDFKNKLHSDYCGLRKRKWARFTISSGMLWRPLNCRFHARQSRSCSGCGMGLSDGIPRPETSLSLILKVK